MIPSRFDRYRSLSAQVGPQPARALIDRLQVLALTEPDTLQEMEHFLDRGGALAPAIEVHRIADRRQNPDRRSALTVASNERRRGPRRANELSKARDA